MVDTPGRVYDDLADESSDSSLLLSCLIAGVPWKTKLCGRGALSISEISNGPSVPQNAAHHVIIVFSAHDLIHDEGWGAILHWKRRYSPSAHASEMIRYGEQLVASVMNLLGTAPYVAVTHLDNFGGVSNSRAISAASAVLRQFIPVERSFFVCCDSSPSEEDALGTRAACQQLQQRILCDIAWAMHPQ
jgi:hypothetical protein